MGFDFCILWCLGFDSWVAGCGHLDEVAYRWG